MVLKAAETANFGGATMSDHPTRQHLVRLIRESGGCTISELRQRTGLSRSTLRQHLALLMRTGLVETQFIRRATGRPPLVYRLTPKSDLAAPETYAAFLHALFTGMQSQGRERIEALFQDVADHLVATHPEIRRLPDLKARLDASRRLFFGETDSTTVEPSDKGYKFSIYTCPLAPVAMEFRDLCCVTRAVLSGLVGQDVEQSEWIIRGDPRCTFEVRASATSPRHAQRKHRSSHAAQA